MISLAGKDVEVEDLEVSSSTEHYNEYQITDGSTVKIKGVLTSLVKVVGSTLPDGSPILLAALSPVVVAVPKG